MPPLPPATTEPSASRAALAVPCRSDARPRARRRRRPAARASAPAVAGAKGSSHSSSAAAVEATIRPPARIASATGAAVPIRAVRPHVGSVARTAAARHEQAARRERGDALHAAADGRHDARRRRQRGRGRDGARGGRPRARRPAEQEAARVAGHDRPRLQGDRRDGAARRVAGDGRARPAVDERVAQHLAAQELARACRGVGEGDDERAPVRLERERGDVAPRAVLALPLRAPHRGDGREAGQAEHCTRPRLPTARSPSESGRELARHERPAVVPVDARHAGRRARELAHRARGEVERDHDPRGRSTASVAPSAASASAWISGHSLAPGSSRLGSCRELDRGPAGRRRAQLAARVAEDDPTARAVPGERERATVRGAVDAAARPTRAPAGWQRGRRR